MGRTAAMLILLLTGAGCLHPLRTDSRLVIDRPVEARFTAELEPRMQHYNFHRPHSATEHEPPAPRLGLEANNVLRNGS